MQGNLNEIDIPSILQLIEWGQRTGQLLVKSHNFCNSNKISREGNKHHHCLICQPQQYWFVFFLNGQIIYCQQGDGSLSRIDDYLRHYRVEMQLDDIQLASLDSVNVAEYSYLWALLAQNMINPKVARDIMHNLVYETLFDLLSLHEGSFIFHQSPALTPQLTTWEITPLVTKIAKQLQHWQQLYPYIQSPDQVPMLSDVVQLHTSLPVETVNKLKHWADGKTSLRQLARYLNRDIFTVAKAIYPYVQQGWLQLVYSNTCDFNLDRENSEVDSNGRVRIVSIQASTTIGETIESILQPQGYEVLTLTNPLESLSLIFQLQPDMIFCDMTMPELDGYEICAMMRQSTVFALVPIILLNAQDRFIDRVKAKMVGTTDFLTKPLKDTEILTLVEKYININYC
ncbi:two-component system response regulator [Nostoc sp. T09]|uniref:response regulator n=1 Tax=Nostoc sp. T09 TaxID=1932621 RepID=UPI000A3AFDE4|nr:response regulator [Nostoc sp. T09]OUL33828.1 two-component system response regulator [Nostoc sp. T09]